MRKTPVSDADLDWLAVKYVYTTVRGIMNLNNNLFSADEKEAFQTFEKALAELKSAYNGMIVELEHSTKGE